MIDQSLSRRLVVYAAISGALAVTLGSFGAHGLDSYLEHRGADAELIARRLEQFDVGVRYHLLHSVVLLALAAVPFGAAARKWAMRLFLAGLILFSGSLYALVISNVTQFAMLAPLGGLCLIAGWISLLPLAKRISSDL